MIRRHASTIGLALLLLFTTYTTLRADPATAHATVSACFVPQEHCEGEIIAAIRGAKQTIRVQAYGFTSPPILGVLAAAKRRGVDVQVILDKSAEQARYTGATYASNAGIPVWIDWRPAIAHSKVIIVDGDLVVTGSFNFTKSAQERNAENVVFIRSADVAGWFLANWESSRAEAEPYRVGE